MQMKICLRKAGLQLFLLPVILTGLLFFAHGQASAKDEAAVQNHDHLAAAQSKAKAQGSSSLKSQDALRGGETRRTMSPANFTGETARSYRIAKEIPEALDSLYCYCDCKKHSGHKSLLSCYVNEHAAYCGICQDEAAAAYDLYKKGLSVKQIRAAVDKEYSNLRH